MTWNYVNAVSWAVLALIFLIMGVVASFSHEDARAAYYVAMAIYAKVNHYRFSDEANK